MCVQSPITPLFFTDKNINNKNNTKSFFCPGGLHNNSIIIFAMLYILAAKADWSLFMYNVALPTNIINIHVNY